MDPLLGEIRLFPFDFAPRGWAKCEGQRLLISQYSALFALLGTQFGGDGSKEFALPDLRGRAIVGATQLSPMKDADYANGKMVGVETVTLTDANIPQHSHAVRVAEKGDNRPFPGNGYFAPVTKSGSNPTVAIYGEPSNPLVELKDDTVSLVPAVGHNNMQPFCVANYCIALTGYYPTRP